MDLQKKKIIEEIIRITDKNVLDEIEHILFDRESFNDILGTFNNLIGEIHRIQETNDPSFMDLSDLDKKELSEKDKMMDYLFEVAPERTTDLLYKSGLIGLSGPEIMEASVGFMDSMVELYHQVKSEEENKLNNKLMDTSIIKNLNVQNVVIKFKEIFKDIDYTEDELKQIDANTKGNYKSTYNYLVNHLLNKYNNSPIGIIKQIAQDVAEKLKIDFKYINTTLSPKGSNVAKFVVNNMDFVIVYDNSYTMKKETFDFKLASFAE